MTQLSERVVNRPARGTNEHKGRITPERAIRAYRESGIEPGFEHLLEIHAPIVVNGTPAIAVVVAMEFTAVEILTHARVDGGWLAERVGVSDDYLRGFHCSWFGISPSHMSLGGEECWAGYRDGVACHAAMSDRPLKSKVEIGGGL